MSTSVEKIKLEKSRTFIALRLPDKLKKELAKVQRHLGDQADMLRFVAPDELHITLAFLGRISDDSLKHVISITQTLASRTSEFSLYPTQLGAFPRLNRPSVIWVGLGGDTTQLTRLTETLEQELASRHILPIRGSGGFMPHITIARVARKHRRHKLRLIRDLLVETVIDLDDILIPSRELVVYRSLTDSQNPTYVPAAAFPFTG